MIKQLFVEYTWEEGGVFTAIKKKDESYVKIIGPHLLNNPDSKAWYKICLTETGASLQITIKDATEESSGDNKENS